MNEKSSLFTGKHKTDCSWVRNLSDNIGRLIYERFIVCGKPEIRKTAKGDAHFLTVEVGDKTGLIELKVWQIPEVETQKVLAWFEEGRVYALEAQVREYNGKTQLNMTWLRDHANRPWGCSENDFFEDDFNLIPAWPFKFSSAIIDAKIFEVIEAIEHPGYKALLMAFWQEKGWRDKFKKWPAAKRKHHAYLGGLLHHVYEMITLAFAYVGAGYELLNVDLLIAGIILHDIGKLDEYQLGLQIKYDEDLGLIGHSARAIELIERAVFEKKIEISEHDLRLLKHLILSHHGDVELGFGSAVSPRTPEARLLHSLDMTSAKSNESYFKIHELK